MLVRRPLVLVLVALVAVVSLAACGDDGGPLDEAEDAMAELDAGKLALQLSATAGSEQPSGAVGFRMEGPFSYEAGGELPVLDMRYTILQAGEEKQTRVVSTGQAVFVVTGNEVVEVPPERTGGLQLGDGEGGVADLGIAGWVRDPKVEKRADGTRVISGKADVADLLSDLARIGEQAGGQATTLDGDASARLEQLVRSSLVTVEVASDGLPRSVKASVDFGADVPEELVQALGPFAAAHLELTVQVERLSEPLKVEKPVAE